VVPGVHNYTRDSPGRTLSDPASGGIYRDPDLQNTTKSFTSQRSSRSLLRTVQVKPGEAGLRSQAMMKQRFSVLSGKYLVNLESMVDVSSRLLNPCRCEPER
jgi:hypothetical protein